MELRIFFRQLKIADSLLYDTGREWVIFFPGTMKLDILVFGDSGLRPSSFVDVVQSKSVPDPVDGADLLDLPRIVRVEGRHSHLWDT